MIRIFTLCSLFYITQVTYSQTIEGTKASPAQRTKTTGGRIGTIIERPRELVPGGDMFRQPTEFRNRNVPQPVETPREGKHAFSDGKNGVNEDEVDTWGAVNTTRYLNRWYRNITGFRLFVDQGVTVGFGNHANHRVDWYGSFGYQFNPIYYLGIGQGYSMSLNNEESIAPMFMNTRVNILDENTTPFLDIKLGYSFVGGQGVFVNPNFGVSFAKGRKAFNIGAGYSFQKAAVKKNNESKTFNYHGLTIRATFEF